MKWVWYGFKWEEYEIGGGGWGKSRKSGEMISSYVIKIAFYMIQLCNILINQQLLTRTMGAELQSSKKHKIHFIMRKQLEFGKSLYVIGNIPQLGSWQVQHALRLSWNKNHFWTGFIELPLNGLEGPIQFKYAIANWENPGSSKIEWEAGPTNRLIQTYSSSQHTICDNSWNMQKITLNLIVGDGAQNQEYFVTGDCKELGNWKRSIKMRQNSTKNIHNVIKASEAGSGKKYIIYSVSFQIFRDKSKIRYSYIKKAQEYEIERHPCRKYELSTQINTHPKCLKITHTNGDTEMFQMSNFQQLNYSAITSNILIGPYLKSGEDFQLLQKQGVSSILSIQTSEDIVQHSITEDYLHQQAQKYGMRIFNYAIQDMSRKDFLAKYLGAILLLKKLVEENKKVYVHCTAGVYRSPQVVSLFLVLTQNLTAQEAIEYVKSRHPYARPNYRIISQALLLLLSVKKLMT